jgi:hypothetical protein
VDNSSRILDFQKKIENEISPSPNTLTTPRPFPGASRS